MRRVRFTGPMWRTARSLVAATTILALGTGAAAADWNTGPGGNAARNCLSTENGPAGPDVLWQGGLPAIVAQQAVIEGDVVVMARIADFTIPTGTTIVAQDLHTGAELWTTQLPFTLGDEWRSRVSAVRDGRVYATRAGNTNSAPMYALDIADGSILWTSEDLVDESTTEGVSFAANGDLVVGNFSNVRRIDHTDGTTVWTVPRACPTSSGCLVSVFGDRGYFWEASGAGPMVGAINVEFGAILYYSLPIGGGFIQQLGLLVGPDGTVYAPRSQNNPNTDFLVAYEDFGMGLAEKWCVPMGYPPFGTMGVGPDGSVYMYDPDDRILRLDPATGATLDVSDPIVTDFLQPRMAIDAAGRLFVTNGGFSQGGLTSYNANLTERWSVPISGVNVGGPALGSEGTLIVCGTGTNVVAYRSGPVSCLADVVGDDGVVGTEDLLGLLAAWGSGDPQFDIDPRGGDGIVGTGDLLVLLAAWGPCP